MRTLILFAAALGLFMSAPAAARDNGDHGDKHDAAGSDGGRGSADAHRNDQSRGMTRQNGRAVTNDNHNKATGVRQNTNTHFVAQPNPFLPSSGDVRSNPPGRSTADRNRTNAGWSGKDNNRPLVVNPRQGNSGWTGNTAVHNYNRDALRRNVQASHRFHGGNYIAPQGYQYRHWSYGERLPRLYYARDYWISNFVMFGLFAPPSDLVWVRVGDDALLIDRDSGEIVQVYYGFFY